MRGNCPKSAVAHPRDLGRRRIPDDDVNNRRTLRGSSIREVSETYIQRLFIRYRRRPVARGWTVNNQCIYLASVDISLSVSRSGFRAKILDEADGKECLRNLCWNYQEKIQIKRWSEEEQMCMKNCEDICEISSGIKMPRRGYPMGHFISTARYEI